MDMPLFDRQASQAAKVEGMERAAANNASLLELAKRVAVDVARRKGAITADDVALELYQKHGISPLALGNAAGSLFKDKRVWQYTGVTVPSIRENAHGRLLRVWKLR